MTAPPFGILPTISGVDVVDNATGHAVDHRETAASANGVAFLLNAASKAGPRALEKALKAG